MQQATERAIALLLALRELNKALPDKPSDVAQFKALTTDYLAAVKDLVDKHPGVKAVAKVMDKQIGNNLYEKSDDPDVVYQWVRQEVHLRGKISLNLEDQIARDNQYIQDLENAKPEDFQTTQDNLDYMVSQAKANRDRKQNLLAELSEIG